jgi:hypothetical protein
VTDPENTYGPYLPPGTLVRYDGVDEGKPEYGIVVHCWLDDEMAAYDCYVAFFGNQKPTGKPTETPYVLRYFSSSLKALDPDTPE